MNATLTACQGCGEPCFTYTDADGDIMSRCCAMDAREVDCSPEAVRAIYEKAKPMLAMTEREAVERGQAGHLPVASRLRKDLHGLSLLFAELLSIAECLADERGGP